MERKKKPVLRFISGVSGGTSAAQVACCIWLVCLLLFRIYLSVLGVFNFVFPLRFELRVGLDWRIGRWRRMGKKTRLVYGDYNTCGPL